MKTIDTYTYDRAAIAKLIIADLAKHGVTAAERDLKVVVEEEKPDTQPDASFYNPGGVRAAKVEISFTKTGEIG